MAAIMLLWWARMPRSPSLVGMERLTQGPSYMVSSAARMWT